MTFDANKTAAYILDNKDEIFRLIRELSVIPAPSGKEEKRAHFCYDWLHEHGAKHVQIDGALNVIVEFGCHADNPICLYTAHSDVVFPDETPLPLCETKTAFACPGIGDDTVHAVGVLMAAKYIIENSPQMPEAGIVLAINSCEEGLGNLKGTRSLMNAYQHRIRHFVSFDGDMSVITNLPVGSHRYRVEVCTEGGHSFQKFGNPNAIFYLASIIGSLYDIKVPDGGRTTYNVGRISGGMSVNTIAQQAEMLYEYRSDKKENLAFMKEHFLRCIDYYRAKGIDVHAELIGERPCKGNVSEAAQNALEEIAAELIRAHHNKPAIRSSGSTDSNIPSSLGIPSITMGCFDCPGAHTREEYVTKESVLPGMNLILDMILQSGCVSE